MLNGLAHAGFWMLNADQHPVPQAWLRHNIPILAQDVPKIIFSTFVISKTFWNCCHVKFGREEKFCRSYLVFLGCLTIGITSTWPWTSIKSESFLPSGTKQLYGCCFWLRVKIRFPFQTRQDNSPEIPQWWRPCRPQFQSFPASRLQSCQYIRSKHVFY